MKKLILVLGFCVLASACDSTSDRGVVEALDAGVISLKEGSDAGSKSLEAGIKSGGDTGRPDTGATSQVDVVPTGSPFVTDAGGLIDSLSIEARPGSLGIDALSADTQKTDLQKQGVFCDIPSPTGDKPSDRSTFVLVTNDPVQACLDSLSGLEKWGAGGRNCLDPANDFSGKTGSAWCLSLIDSSGFPCTENCLVAGLIKMPLVDSYSGDGRRTFPACTTDGKFAGWGCMKTGL